VRLEGLGQLKNPMTSYGNRTRNLPACSKVPQPPTLAHAPLYGVSQNKYHTFFQIQMPLQQMEQSNMNSGEWLREIIK
jgi:hypothetical protein